MKETEQTLLDQIKEQVAKENGSEDWHTYDKKIRYTPVYSLVWTQVCERHATAKAKASCEATLKAKEKQIVDFIQEEWPRRGGFEMEEIVRHIQLMFL